MTHPPSRLCPLDLRCGIPCKYWASEITDSSPCHNASYPLPVRRTSALPSGFLQTRSRPRNPCHWLTLPLAGRVENFHLQVSAPCRTHRKKNRLAAVGASWARMEHWLRARDWGAIAGHAGRRLIPLVRGLEKRCPVTGLVHPKPDTGGLCGSNPTSRGSFFGSGAIGLRMHDVGVEQLHGLDVD